MKVMPIRYSADVASASRFYAALGLDPGTVSRPGGWAELTATSGMLAVHVANDRGSAGRCELGFEADEPLEAIVARLADSGFPAEPIVDENFGRSVGVLDPDGVRVQINEHDRELYA